MRKAPARMGGGLLVIGMAALVAACATTKEVETASRQSLEKTEEVRASLESKIEQINRIQRQAEEQQAKLERLLDLTKSELSTAQQRNAELETRVQEIKGQDLSVVQGQLETIRRDLDGLQSGLDDQKAQVFDATKKLAGKIEEQASRLQAQAKVLDEQVTRVEGRIEALDKRDATALTVLGKKVDERLDVQDRRLEGEGKRAEGFAGQVGALQKDLGQTNEVVKGIGTKLSAQIEQQAQTLAKLEEATRQADVQVRALAADVNRFHGALQEFSKAFDSLQKKPEEIGLRVAKLEAKTEEKVGALVVQEGDRAARLDALRKQVEADGQAMKTLSAKAEQQTSRLDALEKTLNTVVATQNETSGSLGELKHVLEESVGRSAVRADVPRDIPTQPVQRTSIPAEPSRPAGAVPRTTPESALSAKDAYDRAQSQFGKGQYDIALTSFKLFLIQYPDSPLAPNAHFWMAECYYRTRDYERGIEEYEQVVKNYPKSEKASRALYRKAMAFLELNDKDAARATLQQLIAAYPKSEDVKPAREKLAFLNK